MSKPLNRHDSTGILVEVPGLGIIDAWGEAAPTNGVEGYVLGCMWRHIGGAGSSQIFLNVGTLASATWESVASS